MEAVILVGIQGSGKTTLYADRFLETHVRISLDLLRTRHREQRFLEACLQTQQRFVVDKTNETREERARYIGPARAAGFRVVGYLIEVSGDTALERNARRAPERQVPIAGVLGTKKRLQLPAFGEGFDALFRAAPDERDGGWVISALG